MDSYFSLIVVALVSLALSALFSAIEIAFTASNKLLLTIDNRRSPIFNFTTGIFKKAPADFLSTVLVGNNLCLVVFSLYMSQILAPTVGDNIVLETLISTLIVLFMAEFMPKVMAQNSPNVVLRIFIVPALIFYFIFYPISKMTTYISLGLLWLFGFRFKPDQGTQQFDKVDLQAIVEDELASGAATEKEIRIFHNALDFSQVKVRECMIPRVEIEAFDVEGSPEELRKLFIKTKFSRIPIYRESIDTIIGYASSRDLFDFPASVELMLRDSIYVPSSALASPLLEEFIRTHKTIAVVIDEFGTTAGMVTIEDILEEIFGEIDDEHDDDFKLGKVISEGEYLFSARAEITQINQEFSLSLPESDDYETLAGYFLNMVGEIPEVGSTVTLGAFRFTVERADARRISLLRVTKL